MAQGDGGRKGAVTVSKENRAKKIDEKVKSLTCLAPFLLVKRCYQKILFLLLT